MSDQYAKLEKLIEFPSVIGFRVIVDASVANALLEVLKVVDTIEPDSVKDRNPEPRVSSKGNYVSYTVSVKVRNIDNLKTIYTKVGSLGCVKHII